MAGAGVTNPGDSAEAGAVSASTGAPICPLPFMQLQLQPDGRVAPCCFNQELVLGDIRGQTLLEIWNGAPARALRREFLEGAPKSCSAQIAKLGCHRAHAHLRGVFEREEIQKIGPRRLDVRLNGKCNLQCVMCEVWTQPNGVYDSSSFWSEGPREVFPKLLEINVLGGEPFIQKDTFRLLDEISRVNSECSWAFVTNGQWKFRAPVRERLDRVRLRWIQFSLDSLDPATYERIRKDGKLDQPLETLEAIRAYAAERESQGRGFLVAASMTVQKLNWREVPRFLEFCFERKVEPWLHFVASPELLSLLSAPRVEREEALKVFKALWALYRLESLRHLISPLASLETRESGSARIESSQDVSPQA